MRETPDGSLRAKILGREIMFTLPMRLGPLIGRNIRVAAVLLALIVYLWLAIAFHPSGGILDMLVVVLPALEVAMFALMFALVRDELAPAGGAGARAVLLAVWSIGAALAYWLYGVFTVAGIDAYSRLHLPPFFDPSL